MLRDLGAPQPVRCIGDEPPLHQVLMDRRRWSVPLLAGSADTDEAEDAHESGDAFAAHPHAAPEPQLEPDPRRAMGRPRGGVDVADSFAKYASAM